MIKLIVTDIDGTLLNSLGQVTPKTKQFLKQCQQHGIHLCLSSGRDFEELKPVLIEMDMLDEGFACSCNGAIIHDLKNKIEYVSPKFTDYQLQKILDFASKYHTKVLFAEGSVATCYATGIDRFIEATKTFVRRSSAFDYVRLRLNRNIEFISPNASEVKYDYRKAIFLGKYKKLSRLYKKMKDEFKDDFNFFFSGKTVIDVMPKGIDKGKGVVKLMQILDLKEDEVICFGDSENDTYMFEVVRYSVAMGNASENVKNKASMIAPSNNEDGIVEVLNKMIDFD